MSYSPFRNLGLKLLSIGIASLLWLVVAGERVVERALRVPLEFQNLPSGLEIVGDSPEQVDVRVRGSSGVLSRLTAGDTSAILDLRTARSGPRLFHLTASQVSVPYGVEVVQVGPSTLRLEFETTGVRVVPVRPTVEGRPAEGYEVTSVVPDPASVEVIGPESALRRLQEAITEPVVVTGATRAVRETVTIGVADPVLRLRVPSAATVTVSIGPIGVGRNEIGAPRQPAAPAHLNVGSGSSGQ